MPRRSHARDFHQEYRDRQQRARSRGFTGYPQERRARKVISSSLRRAGQLPPEPRTAKGRRSWDIMLRRPEAKKPETFLRGAAERGEILGSWKETVQGKVVSGRTIKTGMVGKGEKGYGEAVRFILPGTQWADDRPLVEYRGKFMTRGEAVYYIQQIERSTHVLVVVQYVDENGVEYFEVWLDTISD